MKEQNDQGVTLETENQEPVGEDITEEQMREEAQAMIDADEIAVRVRALASAIVTIVAHSDNESGRSEPRTQGDPAFRTMEAGLDLLDLVMREQRKTREALERIAHAFEAKTAEE